MAVNTSDIMNKIRVALDYLSHYQSNDISLNNFVNFTDIISLKDWETSLSNASPKDISRVLEGFESVESAFEGHLDTNETKVNIASIISIAAIIIIASLVFYAYKKRPQGRGNRPDDNRTLGGIEMQGA